MVGVLNMTDTTRIHHQLSEYRPDPYSVMKRGELPVTIKLKETLITLAFEGFEDAHGGTTTAIIEQRLGVPHLIVWADSSDEDPTQVISLAKCRKEQP